jgi:hypothetical protein
VALEPPPASPDSPAQSERLAPPTLSQRRRLEVRVSTVLVALAALSLCLMFLLKWLDDLHPGSSLDGPLFVLMFGIFPLCSVLGAFSAFNFTLWKRRRQFVLELIVALAFLAFISTWEFP